MCILKLKKTKKIMAMLMTATVLTGCGGGNDPSASSKPKVTSESKTSVDIKNFQEITLNKQEMPEQQKKFTKGINQFSYRIFEKSENGKNIFLSPYSIATAFSMLANGAEGETKQEIMDLLKIRDLEKWNAYIKEYTGLYEKEETKLLTANSVWVSNRFVLSPRAEQEFFAPLSAYYHGKQEQQDLSTDTAREKINNWVSENTDGMINPFLKNNLDLSVQMLLANAVYFKGDWALEFKKEDTKKLVFVGASKETKVDMMCMYGENFKYIEKNGIRGVELPYLGNNFAMDIIIPAEKETCIEEPDSDENKDKMTNTNIREHFGSLSQKEKDEIFDAFDKAETEKIFTLKIPKFTMEYEAEKLEDSLKELGLSTALSKNGNFDKIATGIYVDKILHKAKIEVDEKGTKASAVTGIMMKNDAAVLDGEEINFIVLQPFIYVIRDIQTGTILFMGDMQDME